MSFTEKVFWREETKEKIVTVQVVVRLSICASSIASTVYFAKLKMDQTKCFSMISVRVITLIKSGRSTSWLRLQSRIKDRRHDYLYDKCIRLQWKFFTVCIWRIKPVGLLRPQKKLAKKLRNFQYVFRHGSRFSPKFQRCSMSGPSTWCGVY